MELASKKKEEEKKKMLLVKQNFEKNTQMRKNLETKIINKVNEFNKIEKNVLIKINDIMILFADLHRMVNFLHQLYFLHRTYHFQI